MGFDLFRGNNMFFELGQSQHKKSHTTHQHLYNITAIEQTCNTLKIIALTIRINLFPQELFKEIAPAFSIHHHPLMQKKFLLGAWEQPKFEEIPLGRRSSLILHVAQNISLCCLRHGICQKHLLGALQCSCLGPAKLTRMSTEERLSWKFLCTQTVRSRRAEV